MFFSECRPRKDRRQIHQMRQTAGRIGFDIEGAKQALDALKSSSRIRFELIPDDIGAAQLPSFVKKPQSVTDGHLVELARKNSVRLVTLDRNIPSSLYIG